MRESARLPFCIASQFLYEQHAKFPTAMPLMIAIPTTGKIPILSQGLCTIVSKLSLERETQAKV